MIRRIKKWYFSAVPNKFWAATSTFPHAVERAELISSEVASGTKSCKRLSASRALKTLIKHKQHYSMLLYYAKILQLL